MQCLWEKCFAAEHSHARLSLSWLPRIRTFHGRRSPKLSLLWRCGGVSYSSPKTIYRLQHLKALGTSIHTELCYRIGVWVQNVIHRNKKDWIHQSQGLCFLGFFFSKGNTSWISAVFFLMITPHDCQIFECRRLKWVSKSGTRLISQSPSCSRVIGLTVLSIADRCNAHGCIFFACMCSSPRAWWYVHSAAFSVWGVSTIFSVFQVRRVALCAHHQSLQPPLCCPQPRGLATHRQQQGQ